MPESPWLLGIEIGGTKLQLGLGRNSEPIRALKRIPARPEHGAEGIRRQITDALEPWLAAEGVDRSAIAAIGVGFGGPVDADRGRVERSFQVHGWDDFPLADWLRQVLDVPRVTVQNDADTAALGEARFGAGQGHSPVLYVNSGSGVGGGLIVEGRIYRGAGRGAVEIGHLRIPDPERASLKFTDEILASPPPGAFRFLHEAYQEATLTHTLESLASGWAIERHARKVVRWHGEQARSWRLLELAGGDPERITTPIVAEAARQGDPVALRILDRATTAMGTALAHAVTLLAPRRVVLGGGVSLIEDRLWLEPIRRTLRERVFPPFRDQFDLVSAQLGEEVVVRGALALAHDACAGG